MTAWSGPPRGRPPTGFHGRLYRCIYCRIRITAREKIPSHEAQCPMRASIRQAWAIAIERGKRKLGAQHAHP